MPRFIAYEVSQDYTRIRYGEPWYDVPWGYRGLLQKAKLGYFGEDAAGIVELIASLAYETAMRKVAQAECYEYEQKFDTIAYDIIGIERYPNG